VNKVFSVLFSGWLFVIGATMISLQSCDQYDCGGLSNVGRISSFELNVYAIGEKMSSQTQDRYKLIEYNGEDVSYDSILIELDLLVERVSELVFGLTSTVACSPLPPVLRVAQLSITSDMDYNEDYQAGENLIDIFNIQSDLSVNSGQSLKSYMADIQGYFYDDDWRYLSIGVPPSELRSHKFQVQFTLQDATIMSMSTESILIR
jgi:hypothetical protein